MHFVEVYVLDEYFTGDLQDHVLKLRNRRPDLWETVELTCKNTNDRIPTLDIINEILENYIATNRLGFSGELSDRATVEGIVYQKLSDPATVFSFRQPFMLPLEMLQIYLRHFGRTRADVARLLNRPPRGETAADLEISKAAAALEISKREYDIITQPITNFGLLQNLYGISFEQMSSGIIKPFDAQELLKPMGLSRAELGELVDLLSSLRGTAGNVRIVGEKKDEENSVQNYIENIHKLNTSLLDIMHRFTRLWRRVPWSMSELYMVLYYLEDADLSMGSSTVQNLIKALYVQKRLGLSVEASALSGAI